MRYTTLGRSGTRVSELCLGTMTFGEDWGWGASKEDSLAMFDAFAQAGGNFIDTSSNYTNGTAESFVGDFISADRDFWVVATKYTLRRPGSRADDLNAGGNARKNMMRTVEASLRRLDTDHIDLLYLHMWDYSTPVEEVMRGFDDLVRAGKVLQVGFSDTPAWVVARAQTLAEWRGYPPIVAYQAAWNVIRRGVETDVLPLTKSFGMSLLAFDLLGGGVLTGKFNQPGGPTEPTRARIADEAALAAAEVLMRIAAEIGNGATASQVAINWVRQRSPNAVPILGARRPAHLDDTLGALEFALSDEQMAELNGLRPAAVQYPHDFWNDYVRRNLIYGEWVDAFEGKEWPR